MRWMVHVVGEIVWVVVTSHYRDIMGHVFRRIGPSCLGRILLAARYWRKAGLFIVISVAHLKTKRERQRLSLPSMTPLRHGSQNQTPDIYRLLQKVLVDLWLFCTFHLDQANGALCNAED